jgi:hypothetical protein
MSHEVLPQVDEADLLALTLARAREFARAVGIVDDAARRGGAGRAPVDRDEGPELDAAGFTSPRCVPAGDGSGKQAEQPQ